MKGIFSIALASVASASMMKPNNKDYGYSQPPAAAAAAAPMAYNNYANGYSPPQAQAQAVSQPCCGQAQAQAVTMTEHVTTTMMWNQYASPSAVVAAAAVQTHQVVVGGAAGLVYTPSSIMANPGDVVNFTFRKTNHTVTQSTFGAPCVKAPNGVDSDFKPNPDDKSDGAPTYQFTVASMDPTWFYCKQGKHCLMGMVFAINPTAQKTFEQLKANAMGSAAGSAVAATVTNNAPSATVAAAPTVMGSQVAGTVSNGACSCFCGSQAFPDPAWGNGAFGGYGGVVSMI